MWRFHSLSFSHDDELSPAHVSGRRPVDNLVDNFCIYSSGETMKHDVSTCLSASRSLQSGAALKRHKVLCLAPTQHSRACWLADEAILLPPLHFLVWGWSGVRTFKLSGHTGATLRTLNIICKQQVLTVHHAAPGHQNSTVHKRLFTYKQINTHIKTGDDVSTVVWRRVDHV